jgi:rfaE bifunctional protein kinase chain/domain
VRIDRAVGRPIDRHARAAFERAALAAMLEADAVLLSDYGAGLVTPRFAARIQATLRRAEHPIPVLIDSRYQLLEYKGLTACTPNESEVEHALGIRINDDADTLERAGREILKRTGMAAVVITRGSRGMALFQPDSRTVHVPIYGSDEIADVTGAGDTVMATMTLALAAGATFEAGVMLANYAGGLVVMKRGTATVTAEELRAAVEGGPSRRSDASANKRRSRTDPKRGAKTNG